MTDDTLVTSPPSEARPGRAAALAALGPAITKHVQAHRAAILAAWERNQFDADRLARFGVPAADVQGRAELRTAFLEPLVELLTTALEQGDERCLAVYLDERLRYAPHKAGPELRQKFFRDLIPLDERALLEGAGSLEAPLAAALRAVHSSLLADPARSPVRLLAVGDCLMNEIRVFLPSQAQSLDINVDMRCLYFSGLVGRDISTAQVIEFIGKNPMDLIAFSFLSYEGIPPYSALLREADGLSADEIALRADAIAGIMRRFLEDVRRQTDAPFLVHNASGLPLTRFRKRLPFLPELSPGRRRAVAALNERIADIVANTPNCLLLDEEKVAKQHGRRAAMAPVVPRAIARGAQFHTAEFGRFLSDSYLDVVRSFVAMRKAKVIAVDLDNTLWEGVMADGDVVHHHDRQTLLQRARESGLLLLSVSKNDPANIRWAEMKLASDDFVLHKISWDLKVQSLRQAAEQLDLGLDSFVFIDDNPAELEFVRSQLAMVTALDATDPLTWRSVERVLQFPNTRATEEARQRTELYRQQAQRREALSAKFDYPAMMAGLKLKVRFSEARAADLERVAELVQRTNQFNTTTIRYTKQQLKEMLDNPARRIYVAELADKFGSLGLVAVVIVERRETTAIIDSFVMSCRAMGFQLEQAMMRLVMDAEKDAARFEGRFIPTDRNTPAESLYRDSHFWSLEEGRYELLRTGELPTLPEWFAIENR